MSDHTIANTEFLSAVFGTHETIWCTAFRDDPREARRGVWGGFSVDLTEPTPLSIGFRCGELNTYYCISTMGPDDAGEIHRRIANFKANHLVVLDDIGSGPSAKHSVDVLKLKPSFVIETSPGNMQVGYIWSDPLTDEHHVRAIQDALVSQGLASDTDPGMKNVTRYMRLPFGSNTKASYGDPFAHRLRQWHPDTRYTPEKLIDAYQLKLEAVKHQDKTARAVISRDDDPYLGVLDGMGLLGEYVESKHAYRIECPWKHEHSGSSENAMYWVGGGFRCHHGHCENRAFADLKAWLRQRGAAVSLFDADVRQARWLQRMLRNNNA